MLEKYTAVCLAPGGASGTGGQFTVDVVLLDEEMLVSGLNPLPRVARCS